VLQIVRIPGTFFRSLYFVLIMNDEVPAGIAKPPGEDAFCDKKTSLVGFDLVL